MVGGVATFVLRPVRAHIPTSSSEYKSKIFLSRVCVGPNAGGRRRKKKRNDQ